MGSNQSLSLVLAAVIGGGAVHLALQACGSVGATGIAMYCQLKACAAIPPSPFASRTVRLRALGA